MEYIEQFIALADGAKLITLIALILANFCLGVAISIYTKTFRLKALGDFLWTRIIPYILGYFAVVLVAIVEPNWLGAIPVVWTIIIISLIGAILHNLKEIGVNLPDFIAGDNEDE